MIACLGDLDLTKLSTDLESTKAGLSFVDSRKMRRVRGDTNALEHMGSNVFMNRAALKMAELDTDFDLILNACRMPRSGGSVRVADLGAAPGGFTEYIQWRAHRIQRTKRIRDKYDLVFTDVTSRVVTLNSGGDDGVMQLDRFNIDAPTNTVRVWSDSSASNDLQDPLVIRELIADVDIASDVNNAMALVTCDGGFSVDGQHDQQELLSAPLIAGQLAAALGIVAHGGTVVCKLFDRFHWATICIVALVTSCFDRFTIVKPVTSRPANAEVYLVCEGMRALDAAHRASVVERLLQLLPTADSTGAVVGIGHCAVCPSEICPSTIEFLREVTVDQCRRQQSAVRDILVGLAREKPATPANFSDSVDALCLRLSLPKRGTLLKRARNTRRQWPSCAAHGGEATPPSPSTRKAARKEALAPAALL